MKRQIFTWLVLPFYLVVSASWAAADNQSLAAKHVQKQAKLAQFKRNAAALCAALLTTTTASAVVVTKMNHQNPIQGWAVRNRLHRDQHALAIFLGRGLKKKFYREEIENPDDDVEIVEEYESLFAGIDVERILRETDSATLSRSIFYTESTAGGGAKGYIVLPGLVSRFEVRRTNNETRDLEFILRALGNESIIARGVMRDLARHMPRVPDVQTDAVL